MTSTGSGGVSGTRSSSGLLPGDALRPDTAIGSLAPAWLTDGSKIRSALVDGPRQDASQSEKDGDNSQPGSGSVRRGEALPASSVPFGGPLAAGQQSVERWNTANSVSQRGGASENSASGRRTWREEERSVPNRQAAPQPRWNGHSKEQVGAGGWSAEEGAHRHQHHHADFSNPTGTHRRSSDRWVADASHKGGTPGRPHGAQFQASAIGGSNSGTQQQSQQQDGSKGKGEGGTSDRWNNHGGGAERWGGGSDARSRWGGTAGQDGDVRSMAPLSPHGPSGPTWQSGTVNPDARRVPPPGVAAPGGPPSYHGLRGPPNGVPGVASDAGRGRGFGMGRGRSAAGSPGSGTNVAPSWTAAKAATENSAARGGDAVSGRLQYSQEQALQVLRSLRRGPSAAVALPDGLQLEDASLVVVSGQVDVEGILGTSPPWRSDHSPDAPTGAAAAAADLFSLSLSHPDAGSRSGGGSHTAPPPSAEPDQRPPEQRADGNDEWLYRDPKGEVQGPFPRADIVTWFEDGFFPSDLPIRAASSGGDEAFVPLSSVMRLWGAAPCGPPGFPSIPTPRKQTSPREAPASAAPLVLPQLDSHAAGRTDDMQPDQASQPIQEHHVGLGEEGQFSNATRPPPRAAGSPPSQHLATSQPLQQDLLFLQADPVRPTDLTMQHHQQQSSSAARPSFDGVSQSREGGHSKAWLVAPSPQLHASRPAFQDPQPQEHLSSASSGELNVGRADRQRPRLSAFERMRQGGATLIHAPHHSAVEDDLSQVLGFLLPPQQQQQQAQQQQARQYPQLPEELVWDSSQAGIPQIPPIPEWVPPIPEWMPPKDAAFAAHHPPPELWDHRSANHTGRHSDHHRPHPQHSFNQVYQEPPPISSAWEAPEQQEALVKPPVLAPQLQLAMSLPQIQPSMSSQGSLQEPDLFPPAILHHGRPTHQQQQQQQQVFSSSQTAWQLAEARRDAGKQQGDSQWEDPSALHNSAPLQEGPRSTAAAPWASVAPAAAPPTAGSSLVDIQREEARRSAAARAAAQAAGHSAAQSCSAWGKVAAGSSASAAGLQEVMAEEQRRRRGSVPSDILPPPPPIASGGGGGSGFTLGDYVAVTDRPQPTTSAWKLPGTEAASRPSMNQTIVEQRRLAAQMKAEFTAQGQKVVRGAAAAADGAADDHMFWDYGALSPPLPDSRTQQQQGMRESRSESQQQEQAGSRGDGSRNGVPDDASHRATSEGPPISPAFRSWCREQMQSLRGDPDLALIEFLVGLASSGETVDYIQLYLKDSVPNDALTAFTTEFLRRKLNDQAGGKRKTKTTAAQSTALKPSAPARAAVLATPASDWAKIPKKAKGKKSKPVAAEPTNVRSSGFAALDH